MTYDRGYAQFAPQPERPKRKVGRFIGFGCLGVLLVVAAIISLGALISSTTKHVKPSASSSAVTPSATATSGTSAVPTTEVAKFKACVGIKGLPQEKSAVKHVLKVQGADKANDILDSAEVYTDLKGGLTGPDYGTAKLIASAFASCYTSENGLVTVYDKTGSMLATGNF